MSAPSTWRARFHVPLLVVSAIAMLGALGLTLLVSMRPFLPLDAAVERDVQSVNVGPLAMVFAFYTAIGGPMGIVGEAIVVAAVLLVNRAAWRLLVAAALASGWYFLVSNLIIRARPTVPDVLRVTEHPGASSFPSGHMILFVFYASVLVLCIGYRYLPRSWIPSAWVAAGILVTLGGISRMYSGAHWPTDVLAGACIAIAWISLVVAVRWISDPALARRPATATSTRRPTPLAA